MVDLQRKVQYSTYITEHKENVKKGFRWICQYLSELIPNEYREDIVNNIYEHDESKYSEEEYEAYAEYFYGRKTNSVKEAFNFAWLHHIHNNPHHWQHWVLINDEDGVNALEMPYSYVIEMICDWWAFSWKSGDLTEIYDWYDGHKKGMMLNPKTKELVENILAKIIDKVNELAE